MARGQFEFVKFKPGCVDGAAARLAGIRQRSDAAEWHVARLGADMLACVGRCDSEAQASELSERLERLLGGELAERLMSRDSRSGDEVLTFRPAASAPAFQRFVVIRMKPGKVDEIRQAAEPALPAIFGARPGFLRYSMVRTGDDSGVFVSSWETRAQAQAEVLGSFKALRQLGPSMVTIGRLLPAFISFDSYVGEVLPAGTAAA